MFRVRIPVDGVVLMIVQTVVEISAGGGGRGQARGQPLERWPEDHARALAGLVIDEKIIWMAGGRLIPECRQRSVTQVSEDQGPAGSEVAERGLQAGPRGPDGRLVHKHQVERFGIARPGAQRRRSFRPAGEFQSRQVGGRRTGHRSERLMGSGQILPGRRRTESKYGRGRRFHEHLRQGDFAAPADFQMVCRLQ